MINYNNLAVLQDELNVLSAGENWIDGTADNGKAIDFYEAIMVESVELYDSFSWQWWKGTEDNIPNAKVEAIDILHFTLSQMMVEKCSATDYDKLLLPERLLEEEEQVKEINFDRLKDATRSITVVSGHPQLVKEDSDDKPIYKFLEHFNVVLDELFESDDEIYRLYLGKNILNKCRQLHGYKDGTYIKIWVDKDGNPVEDNVVMQEILDSMETLDIDAMYAALEDRYVEAVNLTTTN